MGFRIGTALLLGALVFTNTGFAQKPTREQKVRDDRAKVESEGHWIYNDLDRGFQEARKSGKPMIVVLRCIPCEECVKLDDDIVNNDPELTPLMEKFVRVRIVSTNGLDLSLFQFDTDQSFATFFLNADRTIYGRFGTRSHRTEWVGDVSVKGLARTMQGVLDLHANYPKIKASLSGKQGPAPLFASPEKFPSLQNKYTDKLNYAGNVVQSCIHCHQIGDAQRLYYRERKEPIPEEILYPHPHPSVVGLTLDPNTMATVKAVRKDSIADQSGFRPADVIASLDGQPIVSMADVQWVLHRVPAAGGKIKAVVLRQGQEQSLSISLPESWRRAGDLTWRSSTWGLRRMATGGMVLESTEEGQLLVKRVGQYGAHAAAKNAGFQVGDIVLEFGSLRNPKQENEILIHGVTQLKAGDRVPVTVRRAGKTLKLVLPMQE